MTQREIIFVTMAVAFILAVSGVSFIHVMKFNSYSVEDTHRLLRRSVVTYDYGQNYRIPTKGSDLDD